MVRSTIITYDTGAVDTEHYVQVLQRHVMDDVVVSTLQESRVDIAVGHHTRFGQTGTECHGMTFRDTYVEDAFRQLFLHNTHRATRRHRRRDTYYLLVLLRQFQQGLTKNLLPQRRNP